MLGHRVLNVEDYLTILKRRWWIIAIPMIILPIVAVVATYFITPQYVSQTVILIDQQKVPTDFVQPVATQDLDSRLAIITEQVLSRSNIQPIIEKYNLFANQHLSMDARIDLMRDPKTLKIEPVQSELARSNGLPGSESPLPPTIPRPRNRSARRLRRCLPRQICAPEPRMPRAQLTFSRNNSMMPSARWTTWIPRSQPSSASM